MITCMYIYKYVYIYNYSDLRVFKNNHVSHVSVVYITMSWGWSTLYYALGSGSFTLVPQKLAFYGGFLK